MVSYAQVYDPIDKKSSAQIYDPIDKKEQYHLIFYKT